MAGEGTLELLCGPSGVGKSTLARGTIGVYWYTTRPKRSSDKDEHEKCIINDADYDTLHSKGMFLYELSFNGARYGLHRSVQEDLDKGKDVAITVVPYNVMLDLQRIFPKARTKAILASPSDIERRLNSRGESSDRVTKIITTIEEYLQKGLDHFDEVLFNFQYEREQTANFVMTLCKQGDFQLIDHGYLGRVAFEVDLLAQKYNVTEDPEVLKSIHRLIIKAPWAFSSSRSSPIDDFVYALDPTSPAYEVFTPIFIDRLYQELNIRYDRSHTFLHLNWLADTAGESDFISYSLAEMWFHFVGRLELPHFIAQSRTPHEIASIFEEFSKEKLDESNHESNLRFRRLFQKHNLSDNYAYITQQVPRYLRQGFKRLQQNHTPRQIKSLAESARNYDAGFPDYYFCQDDLSPLSLITTSYKLLRGYSRDETDRMLPYWHVLTKDEQELLGISSLGGSSATPAAVKEGVLTAEECDYFRKEAVRILPVFLLSKFGINYKPDVQCYASIERQVTDPTSQQYGSVIADPQFLNQFMFES